MTIFNTKVLELSVLLGMSDSSRIWLGAQGVTERLDGTIMSFAKFDSSSGTAGCATFGTYI